VYNSCSFVCLKTFSLDDAVLVQAEAFDAKDHNTSVKKWRELFGDNFGELKEDNGNKKSAPVIVSAPKLYAR